MLGRLALILFDTKRTRLSVNALVGALETAAEFEPLELLLPSNEAHLERCIAECLAAGKTTIVGLSFTTPRLWRVREMVQRLPRSVLWVAGGPHPTADPEGTLRLGFDVVVRGEGESTLLDLLRAVAAGEGLGQVPGIVYRNAAGDAVSTGRRRPIDLDAFPPFPLRRRWVVGTIEITRGCPFACAFCQTSHLLGARPRYRSVETIARYAAVIRQRALRDVRFVAPSAFAYGSPDGRTLNLPALEALLATLRATVGPEGRLFFGTFPSEVRPEHVTPDTLALVKRFATNENLVIGAQSGSDRMLAHCRRGHTVADVLTAVSRTAAAGLKPHVDFIFGLPGETDDDIAATIDVLRELAAMGAMIHAHTFMPLPQTGFAGEAPGKIPGRLRLLMKDLIRGGILYGTWHEQLREAQRIALYLRDGPMGGS